MRNYKCLVILSICFINYLGIGLVYPVFGALLFDNAYPIFSPGTSEAYRGMLLGILIALTPLAQFFSSPILGTISDKRGRRLVLLIGTAMSCFGYCLAVLGTLFHSMTLLLLYRFIVGLSNGTLSVAQAALADMSDGNDKARLFSLLSASAGFGFTIGPFLGGQLAGLHYGCPFIVSGLLCLINFLFVLLQFPKTQGLPLQSKARSLSVFKQVMSTHSMKWLFIGGFMFSFGWAFFNEFIPVLLRKRFDFSMSDVGYYYAWGGLGYVLSNALFTRLLLKRIEPHRLTVFASIGCAFCMLLYAIVTKTPLVWTLLPLLMYCIALVYPTASALVSQLADKESQGQILGCYQAVQAFAMGCSPLIFGSAVGTLPEFAGWGGALMMLFAAIAFVAGSRFGLRKPEQIEN